MTYSLVARDAGTGELAVGVQSHFFCVGPAVAWARAGVGAVATQALVEPDHGPRGLELLAGGATASDALARLVAADPGAETRQVGIVDAAGRVAVHTGSRCIAHAGHAVGDGVAAQANIMRAPGVPEAMLAAFERAPGPLAERVVAALDAAEAAGGDLRGRQSAALVVARDPGAPLAAVDLRVDDHPEPLAELRRLLALRGAYDHQERGEALLDAGRPDDALAAFDAAVAAAPDSVELAFWRAVALDAAGRGEAARAALAAVRAAGDDAWDELLRRLPAAGLADPGSVARLLDR